jgi:membrane fusion protein, copper/silver efflux system
MSSDEQNVNRQSEVPQNDTGPVESSRAAPPVPPRPRRAIWMLLIIIALAAGTAYIFRGRLESIWKPRGAQSPKPGERKVLYYQCSMHPEVKSDKPGKCPICGMDLNPVHAEETAPATKSSKRKVLYWQDAMNPQNHYDKPGKAPDGMDLVPVYEEEPSGAVSPSEGSFKISSAKQQLIGVQYGEVTRQPLTKTIRTVAKISYDETRIVHVHAKIEGWIERVLVDFTGQLVAKNQPLLSIYSPELVATQDEYLLALRAKEKLGSSSYKDVAASANSMLEAARGRLELWDISEEQIAEVEKTRKPIKALMLYSPVSGFVTARNAYENLRITPDTELYVIADLSTVWAIADFYEYEIRDIKLGQTVMLTIDSFPGRTFRGKVTYIYPQLDNTTRTLRVRVEFPNPDFTIKPDMYANASLKIEYGQMLAVPREAVLDSGTEQLVFVALEGGYFEPRKVTLGDRVDNQVIVLSGLKAGEKVVTSGNFLIDSESKLKSAASGMGMPGMEDAAASGQKLEQSPDTAAPQNAPMGSSKHQSQKKDELLVPSNHPGMPEQNNHD